MEDLEGAISAGEISKNDGSRTAMYHCNYCTKDISGKIRIKCAICPDFDLCVECFSVGAELTPHRSSHPYRVVKNLSFPLLCPDWNAGEEILLLEGIDMFGMGDWAVIAEHVGTKTKSECIDHYNSVYINSPCFPLPDMSRAAGKNKQEPLPLAKDQGDMKVRVPTEQDGKESQSAVDERRSTGEMKPVAARRPPTLRDYSGRPMLTAYNEKRHEFEIEYDNDAEKLLADMEFHETDTEAERELKLRVIRSYNRRLDERNRRKDFVLERNLLYPDPSEESLSAEERQLCRRYRVLMRLHSKEDHEELLRTVVGEHRLAKRVQELQECRAAGCRTSAEADRYIAQKRGKEAGRGSVPQNRKDGLLVKKANPPITRTRRFGIPRGRALNDASELESIGSSTAAALLENEDYRDDGTTAALPGSDLLSENEKRLCLEMGMPPSQYLNMAQLMSVEAIRGNITKKSDAYGLFERVDPHKLDKIFDMLVRKGLIDP